ncbi:hypothetical protein GCM10027051_36510 [Niabella terrae]
MSCKKPITKGRTDKKFCDSGCKDNYYNALKSEEQKEIGRIDTLLKRNRRILKRLYDPRKEENIVHREKLIREGFEFDYHTHHWITKSRGDTYFFCYDYAFRQLDHSHIRIIKSFK